MSDSRERLSDAGSGPASRQAGERAIEGAPERHIPLAPSARLRRRDTFDLAAMALIVISCAIAYAATLNHEFVFDDEPSIELNAAIQIDSPTPEQLARTIRSAKNRPVPYVSFALNHWLGGLDPSGYRLVNIAIHATNGLLVYAIACVLLALSTSPKRGPTLLASVEAASITTVRPAALIAALIFTLHPVQVQAVTYVVQRITSLAVLFCLVSYGLFLWARLASGRRRRFAAVGSACAFLLAIATKEISACLPGLMLITEWFFFRDLDRAWTRSLLRWSAAGCVLLAVLGLVYLGGEFSLPGYARRDFTMGERLLTQPRVVLFYLGLVLLPHPSRLSVHQVFETSHSLLDPASTIAALAGVAGLLVAAVLLAPRARLVSFCVLWFFVTLAIESTFIPLEMAFEHRLYFPLVGLSILFAWLFSLGLARRPAWAIATALLLTLALGAATVERNRAWRTRVSLWSDVVEKNAADERGHYNLGRSLVREGRTAEAIPEFEAALRLRPDYFRCHVGLGQALSQLGRNERAIHHYREALRVHPEHIEAWMALTNIGAALTRLGRVEEAEAAYREVLAIHPDAVATRYYLALLLESLRRPAEARAEYESVLATEPRHADALAALGTLHRREGRLADSSLRFEALIRLRPEDPRGHAGIGIALAAQGRLAEATDRFEEVLRLSPNDRLARSMLERIRRKRAEEGPSAEDQKAR